ncbi:MAG: serine hydrolase domain-containing protein [Steroidobacteraceae bacterium]
MLGALAASVLLPRPARTEPSLAGPWTGVLEVGAGLRLRLLVGEDGSLTLVSLDQGDARIPCIAEAMTEDRIAFRAPSVNGRFEGRRVGADRIVGQWTQQGTLPLVFRRGDAAPSAPAAVPLTQQGLRALRLAAGSPALAAAVARRAGSPKFWVDGERQVAAGIDVTVADRWHVGSITKSFTATLVARLVEAGLVGWDDTVGAVLGDAAPQMHAAFRAVTFRHLLSHRAGLQANIPLAQFARYSRDTPDARAERLRWARTALTMPPRVRPNPRSSIRTTAMSWRVRCSKCGPVRAGRRCCAVTCSSRLRCARRDSAHPVRRESWISQPGTRSNCCGDGRKPFPPGEAVTDNPVALGPAGTLHLSLPDLLVYLAAHRDAASPFLSTGSWRTLHTVPFGGDYALGWVVQAGRFAVGNGSNTLWYAEVGVDQSTGIAAAAVCNDGLLARNRVAVSNALRAAAG